MNLVLESPNVLKGLVISFEKIFVIENDILMRVSFTLEILSH